MYQKKWKINRESAGRRDSWTQYKKKLRKWREEIIGKNSFLAWEKTETMTLRATRKCQTRWPKGDSPSDANWRRFQITDDNVKIQKWPAKKDRFPTKEEAEKNQTSHQQPSCRKTVESSSKVVSRNYFEPSILFHGKTMLFCFFFLVLTQAHAY